MIETWFNRPERSYNTENHYNLVLLNRTAIYLDVFLLTQESSWYICLVALPTICMVSQICRHILSPSFRYSNRVDDKYVSFSSHLLNTLLLFTLRKKHNFFWNWKNSNLKFFSHLLKKISVTEFFWVCVELLYWKDNAKKYFIYFLISLWILCWKLYFNDSNTFRDKTKY